MRLFEQWGLSNRQHSEGSIDAVVGSWKEIPLAEFVRIHSVRGGQIMWFLGAGASAAAGFPTADDLIWRFKQAIYCSRERQPIEAVNLADDAVRSLLQMYFDALGGLPKAGSEDEYAAYFEAAYPSEADRRGFLEPFVRGASHSYGHRILAALMAIGRLDIIWTTNFDRCVEDASVRVTESTANLNVIELETADRASNVIDEERWPILVKLHGDFQSRRLKNTPEELLTQDRQLRESMMRCCAERGMAVVGYSGRDQSVMDALLNSARQESPFPGGLFWFVRPRSQLLPSVVQLLSEVAGTDTDVCVVTIPTFDEAASDLLLLVPDVPIPLLAKLDSGDQPGRKFNPPQIRQAGTPPILRLNALPVELPRSCRLIDCQVGGTAAILEAVREADADVLVARRRKGVLAFGDDEELRRVFEPFNITEFGLYDLEMRRFHYDSAELGLCYEALLLALSRDSVLKALQTSRRRLLYVDPTCGRDPRVGVLRKATGSVTGIIPNTNLAWSEGIDISLQARLGELWLCLTPTIWSELSEIESTNNVRKSFIRTRLSKRYNRQMNTLLGAWGTVLTNGADPAEVSAFGISTGVDAVFKIGVRPARSLRDTIRD